MKWVYAQLINGIPVVVLPDSRFNDGVFMQGITYRSAKMIVVTQGFSDYLKEEPDIEKAFVEYKKIIDSKNFKLLRPIQMGLDFKRDIST